MLTKKNTAAEWLFAAFCLVMTAGFICEVPKFVFWSPTILFGGFLAFVLWKKETLRLSLSAALLAVFGVTFVLFTYRPSQTIYYQSYIFLHSFFMFVIGYNLFQPGSDPHKRSLVFRRYMFAVGLMYLVYVGVTFIVYLKDPLGAPDDRQYWSVWYPNYVVKTATGFCVSMMFPLAWGVYSLFFADHPVKRIVGAVLIAVCFAFNVYTRTRLLVFVTPVLLAAGFIVWLAYRKKKTRLALILSVVCVGAVALVLVLYSVFKEELQKALAGTVFYRFAELGLRSTRWKFMLNVLKNFSFLYLGGGANSAAVGVPHNLWLYVYDFGGIVPFLVYTAFTVFVAVGFVRFLKNRDLPFLTKVFVSMVLFVTVTELMMEDLLYGLPSFVQMAHFVFGVICGAAEFRKNQTPLPGPEQ